MKAGKVSEKIFKRSVVEPLREAAGDCGSDIKTASETVFADGPLSVYICINKAVNGILIKNAEPRTVSVNVTVYENTDERALKSLMAYAGAVCKELGLSVSCGHTNVAAGCGVPIMTVVCAGSSPGGAFTEKAVPACGMHIVMTKAIGIEGTAIILDKFYDSLLGRFSAGFLENCGRFKYNISIYREVSALRDIACDEDIAIAECLNAADGGVFGALWRLSDRTSHGVEIYLKDIPVWQETVEFTELYNINPYQMASAGSVIVVTDKGEQLVEKFKEHSVSAAIIGALTDNNDKVVISGEEKRHLESSAEDEIYKII